LHPSPIGAGGGRCTKPEPTIGIALVGRERVFLIPHGIGGHFVKKAQAAVGFEESRAIHGVTQRGIRLHIVEYDVAPCHGERLWVYLLIEESQRCNDRVTAILLAEMQMSLDQ